MPFRSKRQWRAAFSGRIPGIDKEKAREWAHETKPAFKKLPSRTPSQKGKPTLRSKESALQTPLKRALRALRESRQGQKLLREAATELDVEGTIAPVKNVVSGVQREKQSAIEVLVPHFAKLAQMMGMGTGAESLGALSSATAPASPVDAPQPARGSGDFTPNRPKKPGMPLRRQATNPRLRILDAMNKGVT